MPQNSTQLIHNDAGFTLLEIIAVLVIMSILAVVAVPKYFDLQQGARQKAMETGLAEGIGRVNGYFARQVLGGSTPSEINYQNPANLGTNLGDFILGVGDETTNSNGETVFRITVTGKTDSPLAGMSLAATVVKPGIGL